MEGPYRATKGDDGTYDIRTASGRAVHEGEDQEFLDFLTWLSEEPKQENADFQIAKPTHFFTEIDPLVEHLKTTTQLIKTNEAQSWASPRHAAISSNRVSIRKHSFIRLQVAAPDFVDDEFEYSGAGGTSKSGLIGVESDIAITQSLLDKLNEALPSDTSPVRRVSTWPIERSFAYIDISDFSKQPPGHQVLIINSLAQIIDSEKYRNYFPSLNNLKSDKLIEALLCIGDGFIVVFRDPYQATLFAAATAYLVEALVANRIAPVSYYFRMGVHIGKVFTFWDPGREKWNYVGDGINGGQRVLASIGKDADNVLFVSGQIRERLFARSHTSPGVSDVNQCLHNRGRRADKHGKHWRVYEVDYTKLASGWFEPLFMKLNKDRPKSD